MKIDVFCAWGDGPDVGINLTRTEEEAKRWVNPHLHFFYDLTSADARLLAAQLIAAAEQSEQLDALCAEHDEHARLFTKIEEATPLGEEPRGPGKCPTCPELESQWSATRQCSTCVDKDYARAEAEGYPSGSDAP